MRRRTTGIRHAFPRGNSGRTSSPGRSAQGVATRRRRRCGPGRGGCRSGYRCRRRGPGGSDCRRPGTGCGRGGPARPSGRSAGVSPDTARDAPGAALSAGQPSVARARAARAPAGTGQRRRGRSTGTGFSRRPAAATPVTRSRPGPYGVKSLPLPPVPVRTAVRSVSGCARPWSPRRHDGAPGYRLRLGRRAPVRPRDGRGRCGRPDR